MPKRRADPVPDSIVKRPRDQVAVRSDQAEFINSNGFVPSVACDHCLSAGVECIMDRTRRYSKCASCTRQGRVCRCDFHTSKKWDLLRQAESKLLSDLEKTEDELDLLEPELSELQTHLAELHKQVLDKQKQYQEAMVQQHRIRKQQAFFKQRGFKMSEHNAELLKILDEGSPSAALPAGPQVQSLAASADNPSKFI
ncbi:hypothetical protein BJX63DRAFT_438674 [Aspergillus granulosus]|uniref:Zn(2)-C6 fungal-type domain-containing protein n=1 Tax=Aspergillus granulosus TaxID=176169 RepID=A0ABR4GR84_9EURO